MMLKYAQLPTEEQAMALDKIDRDILTEFVDKMSSEDINFTSGLMRDRIKILRARETRAAKRSFSVGDKVRLKGLRGDRYNGKLATIVELKQTKAVIRLDGSLGSVRIPMVCMEAAE